MCAHPDHEISDMSHPFWHKLSKQLRDMGRTDRGGQQQQQQQQFPPPPGSPLPGGGVVQQQQQLTPEQQRLQEMFAPVFERLLNLVRGRMRWVWTAASVICKGVCAGIEAGGAS